MMKRTIRICLGLVSILVVLGAAGWLARYEIMRIHEGLPSFTHEAGGSRDERVAMRDGIELATTIYQPAGSGPWPTVLIRNPYERFDIVVGSWCQLLNRYGYACASQDVRGQGQSEGTWEPLINERNDGIDTLAWLTKQKFQDGNIGMMGPSYLAAVQWAVAGDLPPEVKTLIPAVFTTKSYETIYSDGMFRHEALTAWASMMPSRGMRQGAGEGYRKAIHHRPHNEVDELYFGAKLPWYRDWIANPAETDPYWQLDINKIYTRNPQRITIPILMIGGWYDVFFGPQFEDWENLATQSKSRFVIGPWTHIGKSGEAIDTPNATGGLTQWKLVLDWLGHHLKGEPLVNGPGISTYSMGDNQWVERRDWPPKTTPVRLYLGSDGDAHRCDEANLTPETPTEERAVEFKYDPLDPVPTRGGSGMLAFILPGFDGAPPANVLQGNLCERNDILSYTSNVFAAPLHLAGKIKVGLTVASDAPDTSFTAKILEVFADGRVINIRDGITTLAYRNASKSRKTYAPGTRVELELELWPIEWKLTPGSRLRVDVSSSDFPKYHAHPNRAGIWSAQASVATAVQTLYTGPAATSFVELPMVVPES